MNKFLTPYTFFPRSAVAATDTSAKLGEFTHILTLRYAKLYITVLIKYATYVTTQIQGSVQKFYWWTW